MPVFIVIQYSPCPHCPGVAYQTKSDLTRHIKTVHEKRRDHACPHCPSAFGVLVAGAAWPAVCVFTFLV
jgi:hypothetical protein